VAQVIPVLTRIFAILVTLALALGGSAYAQIVAFGASNISGWNVAASEAIPAQLQSMLREKGYTVTVRNAGVYGNTTAQMRARMDSDIPEGTSIVILDTSGGFYNDKRLGVSREQGEADLAAIKARLAERHIKVIPISAAEVPAPYHQADGIHLTPEGHRLAAGNVLPEVVQILGPPPAASTASTASLHKACIADARRLCAAVLGDEDKRHQCMQEHRTELSKDCLHAIAASRKQQGD
jgi:acyl-CoA thioesterase I